MSSIKVEAAGVLSLRLPRISLYPKGHLRSTGDFIYLHTSIVQVQPVGPHAPVLSLSHTPPPLPLLAPQLKPLVGLV